MHIKRETSDNLAIAVIFGIFCVLAVVANNRFMAMGFGISATGYVVLYFVVKRKNQQP
jgi:hypothetical protein